jgi:hypothetical protein
MFSTILGVGALLSLVLPMLGLGFYAAIPAFFAAVRLGHSGPSKEALSQALVQPSE